MARNRTFALAALVAIGCGVPPAAPPVVVAAAEPPPPAEETVYCVTIVLRRHIPECPEPITAEQASHRSVTWVLHNRGGRHLAEEAVNGVGEPVDIVDGLSSWEYGYDGDRIKEIKNYSVGQRLVYTDVLSKDGTRMDFVAPSGRPKLRFGNVTAMEQEFDEQGHVSRERYFDRLGKPCKNSTGVYEVRFRRNQLGYPIEARYFDDKGEPMLSTEGAAKWVREIGANGAWLSERFFGVNGEQVLTKAGIHSERWSYDEWGNAVETRYGDLDDKPALHNKLGARWTSVRDTHGTRIKTASFGLDGAPYERNDDWSAESIKVDARGRPVDVTRTNSDGTPAKMPRWKIAYDGRNRVTMFTLFTAEGKLIQNGVAYEARAYDDRDNQLSSRFMNDSKKLITNSSGYAEIRTRYNDDDQPIEKTYLDENGRLVVPANGDARTVYSYDAAGKLERTEYFDAFGQPSEKLGAKHLVVMYSGSMRAPTAITRTKEEARLRAEEAKKKIAAGMPFEAAVKAYSDEVGASARGGDLGAFKRGQMVKEFEAGVLATPVGEVSGVIETPFGFHVLERTR